MTMGTTKNDWKKHEMRVTVNGKEVVLRGDRTLYRPMISFKSLVKSFDGEDEALLLELCSLSLSETEEITQEIEPVLRPLIEEFSDLFKTPESLPPTRSNDHAIILKEGTEPIRVRPVLTDIRICRKMRLRS